MKSPPWLLEERPLGWLDVLRLTAAPRPSVERHVYRGSEYAGQLFRGAEQTAEKIAREHFGDFVTRSFTIYDVDMSQQQYRFNLSAPTCEPAVYFDVVVSAFYKVTDARRALQNNITDPHAQIEHYLERPIRDILHRFSIEQYAAAESAINTSPQIYDNLERLRTGLTFSNVSINVNLTAKTQEEIEKRKKINYWVQAINGGQERLLAELLAGEPNMLVEVIERVRADSRERMKIRADMLQQLMQANILEDIDLDHSARLAANAYIVEQLGGGPAPPPASSPALPGGPAPVPRLPQSAWLYVVDGPAAGQELPVRSGQSFGRGRGADLSFPQGGDLLSREHARFISYQMQDGTVRWYIEDTSSAGTYIDGELVHKNRRELHNGTKLQMGDTVFRFVLR